MVTRRTFIYARAVATAGLALGFPRRLLGAALVNKMSPKADLAALMAGNTRFVAGSSKHSVHSARREALAAGQAPFAIVLSCSDSRVTPEIIFDQGLGDLFVVRLAGNFADKDGIGSMQYAVDHFKSSVLMVLGHSSCGAVKATVDNVKAGSPPLPGNIQDVVSAIAPAVRAVLHKGGDIYANATEENVRQNVAKLKDTATIIGAAVSAGTLDIVGAVYDLNSGLVKPI